MNLNKVELIGNLAVDPVVKSLPSGQSVARFRLATDRAWRDAKTKQKKESTEYHQLIAWGKLGEVVGKYLKKGDRIYVDGRLHNRSWEDDKGVKKFTTEIIMQNLIMLGGAKKNKDEQSEKVNDEVIVEEVDLAKATA